MIVQRRLRDSPKKAHGCHCEEGGDEAIPKIRVKKNGMKPRTLSNVTRDGLEVDLVIESGQSLHLFEILTVS